MCASSTESIAKSTDSSQADTNDAEVRIVSRFMIEVATDGVIFTLSAFLFRRVQLEFAMIESAWDAACVRLDLALPCPLIVASKAFARSVAICG